MREAWLDVNRPDGRTATKRVGFHRVKNEIDAALACARAFEAMTRVAKELGATRRRVRRRYGVSGHDGQHVR